MLQTSLILQSDKPGEVTVLTSGSSQTPAGHSIMPQILDYYLIHYVISGKGVFRNGEQRYELGAGDLFIIYPNQLISYTADDVNPWQYTWVGFTGTIADPLLHAVGITPDLHVVNIGDDERILSLFTSIRDHFQPRDHFFELSTGAYVRLLLVELRRKIEINQPLASGTHQESYAIVGKSIRWMIAHYNQPITMEQLADSMGYHRAHLSKLFSKYTGMSPTQYLFKLRMQRAQSLLLGVYTIEQIAASVGYSDALYFSKMFKKWSGVSPTVYRQKIKKD
ncbi:AraC family transcriptional regulator [Paenibacillus contaminans]|uniref:AraC family transcriptional regulator n=1 Tax=Paenibacillus contaminans TaxID=450362 RepID=A0A329MQ57_9BACL|nr:AraC family transcriptional regulator [Paenibacillus contaminans]RAV20057.1 AraC family transcriptional regulator [Paenibacillus contaminans]